MWADMVEKNKTVEKETIGQVVALNSLPDAQEQGDIRGKVIDALGDNLKGEQGLKKLLNGWMNTLVEMRHRPVWTRRRPS